MTEKIIHTALASKVIAVAVLQYSENTDELFDWACYIDAVPGINHGNEYEEVAKSGVKQNRKIAEVLFPEIEIRKYRN